MNIQPGRCSAPARCTLTPERGQALHSHPTPRALCPHLGVRGGHRRALTWHLLLSVQVVAVFIWVFKQVSGKKEAKKKKKIQLCKWTPAGEARVGSDAATV